jgi:arylsulfatase A-like enzyme
MSWAAVLAGIAIVATAGSAPPAAASSTGPNIVVIMLDDMPGGATALLSRMPTVKSLFLDGGVRMSHLYANDPLCCPGRANFLTGLYSHHHGVVSNDASLFRPGESIATALDREGYFTALSGKYLNGTNTLSDKTPPGWDRVAMTDQGYYPRWWVDGADAGIPGYGPKVAGDYAVDFLQDAPAGAPAFLYLSFYAVHSGVETRTSDGYGLPDPGPYDDEDYRCDGVGSYRTPAYNEADVSDKPSFIRKRPLWERPYPLRYACETMQTVDDTIERVRLELQAQGRLKDTLWLLVADNGMAWGDHRDYGKSTPYSTHLPAYFRWPGRWGDGARTETHYGSMVDLAPTLADVADARLGPYPTGQSSPDGRSLVGALDGGAGPARAGLLEEHHVGKRWSGVRTTDGRWHYVEWADGFVELYDLSADPYELENAAYAPQRRRTVADLSKLLDDLMG